MAVGNHLQADCPCPHKRLVSERPHAPCMHVRRAAAGAMRSGKARQYAALSSEEPVGHSLRVVGDGLESLANVCPVSIPVTYVQRAHTNTHVSNTGTERHIHTHTRPQHPHPCKNRLAGTQAPKHTHTNRNAQTEMRKREEKKKKKWEKHLSCH